MPCPHGESGDSKNQSFFLFYKRDNQNYFVNRPINIVDGGVLVIQEQLNTVCVIIKQVSLRQLCDVVRCHYDKKRLQLVFDAFSF